MHDGEFVFILDGFDEILADKRASLQKQILNLAHNNPELIIVVSSRADERFQGWQAFKIFHVLPFEKKQVIELVQKLRYDRIIAKKFIDRVKKDLYENHKSFLSNPLLATMMLLTFDQFADIPEKVHLFYEQAFDTLFAKHDATKEAYKRIMHTAMPIDVFKRYLSYFCLATYNDEKFELTGTEMVAYLRRCLKIGNSSVKPEDFLTDLVESVCTMQKDGLNYVFTHRSFQEFFAAYCLANFKNRHFDTVLMKMARRPTDNVVKMLFDMKRELLENEFLLARLRRLRKQVATIPTDRRFLVRFSSLLKTRITIGIDGKNKPAVSHVRASDAANLLRLAELLYRPSNLEESAMKEFRDRDQKVLRARLSGDILRANRAQFSVAPTRTGDQFELVDVTGMDKERLPKTFEWLNETGYDAFCRREAKLIADVIEEIEGHQGSTDKAIDALLGIEDVAASTNPEIDTV